MTDHTPDSLREYANDQTEYGNIGCGTQSKLFMFADAWEADIQHRDRLLTAIDEYDLADMTDLEVGRILEWAAGLREEKP
jgi:hypothetical protein